MTEAKKKPGRPPVVKEAEPVDTVSPKVSEKEFSGIKIIIRSFFDGKPLPAGFEDANLWSANAVEDYVASYMRNGWNVNVVQVTENKTQGVSDILFILIRS